MLSNDQFALIDLYFTLSIFTKISKLSVVPNFFLIIDKNMSSRIFVSNVCQCFFLDQKAKCLYNFTFHALILYQAVNVLVKFNHGF